MKPIIIGICGRSCCGKSTICESLESKYPNKILHIKSDKFFVTLDKHEIEDLWERPESIRMDKLINSITELKQGKDTDIPSKACTEIFDNKISPKEIILIDGFLLYVQKELTDLFDYKIFIDITDEEIIRRRTERNKDTDFGNIDFIKTKVIPRSKEYEQQQKDNSDLIVSTDEALEEIEEKIQKYF